MKDRGSNLIVKVSINRYVSRQIETIRRKVEANTQSLRDKTLKNLEEIFTMAGKIARSEIGHQRINGKMVPLSLNQRRRWIREAAHVAKTMNSVATNFDEQEIHVQLKELERLVNEASSCVYVGSNTSSSSSSLRPGRNLRTK